MSEQEEILAKIEALMSNEKNGDETDCLIDAYHIIKRTKALLSSHAVIDKETAEGTICVLETEGFHEDAQEFRYELLRLSTHKGK